MLTRAANHEAHPGKLNRGQWIASFAGAHGSLLYSARLEAKSPPPRSKIAPAVLVAAVYRVIMQLAPHDAFFASHMLERASHNDCWLY